MFAHESNRKPEAPARNKKIRLSGVANRMVQFQQDW
jgi:hypothetical protein